MFKKLFRLYQPVNTPPNDLDKKHKSNLFYISTIGIELVALMALGLYIGYWLDTLCHTSPFLTFVFFCVGFIAGIRNIYKTLKKINES